MLQNQLTWCTLVYGLLLMLCGLNSPTHAQGIVYAPTAPFGKAVYAADVARPACAATLIGSNVYPNAFNSAAAMLKCLNSYEANPAYPSGPYASVVTYAHGTIPYPYDSLYLQCYGGTQNCVTGGRFPTCRAGYSLPQEWAEGTACIANSVAHASCPPGYRSCTCDLGYEPDASARQCLLPCPTGQTRNTNGVCALPGTCPMGQTAHPYGGCMLQCQPGSFPNLRNTACVAHTCPIPPLTPLIDPATLDFEKGNRWRPDLLTPAYQIKLKCVQDGIVAITGKPSYIGTSAYRPIPYQKHLLEVVTKDAQLNGRLLSKHPECQSLKTQITGEMGLPLGHALKYRQAVSTKVSRHNNGTAFDLTPLGLTAAQMSSMYAGCGVTNTAVKNERWHTQ